VAVATSAIVVPACSASLTVIIIARRGRRGRVGSRAVTTSLDSDVLKGQAIGVALTGLAAIAPEPVVVGAPVGDGEGHTVFQVVGHVGVVRAVAVHLHGVAVLRPRYSEGAKVFPTLVEVELGVELLVGVNLELAAGTVRVVVQLVLVVLPAGAASVAVVVVTFAAGRVTRVRGGLPGPLVGLHDVELRAVISTDLVGITVVHTVVRRLISAIRLLAGHGNKVKGSDAATVALAEVHVVLDRAS